MYVQGHEAAEVDGSGLCSPSCMLQLEDGARGGESDEIRCCTLVKEFKGRILLHIVRVLILHGSNWALLSHWHENLIETVVV